MRKITDLKKKLVFTFSYLLIVFIFYLLKIPCFFKSIFHIPCPGCGMTRALLSVLNFDFASAISYNFMIFAMPLLYLYFLYDGELFKKKQIDKCILILILLGFIANWICNLI